MHIEKPGTCRINSPLKSQVGLNFIHDSERVLFQDAVDHETDKASTLAAQVSIERAGPRDTPLFMAKIRCSI